MRGLEFDRRQVEEAVDRTAAAALDMDLTWDWPAGVAYYGLCRAWEATGKAEYLERLEERVRTLIDLGLPRVWTVNACAMGHCLLTLYEATGKEAYWRIVLDKVRYLEEDALRFGDRVLQHTVSAGNDFPEQAWADTLFMAAYFLLRAGVKLQDEGLIQDALNQYYWHIQYLQDPESGIYYHGYDHLAGNHMSGIYWGRANAWAAYTMSRVGRLLPKAYLYPQFLEITGSLDEQLAALKKLQTENGLWRTVLDDQESYEEVSASAGIAAAMLEKGNPLHAVYINRAIPGILSHIGANGKVKDVSAGTAVMRDRQGYREVSKRWTQGWGQGLVLAFLSGLLMADAETEG